MLEKALVLDGEEGVGHMVGQAVERHGAGIERTAHGEDIAIHVLQRHRGFAPC